MQKYFGTDGIRGRAGDTLTPELALRAAAGYAQHLGTAEQRHSAAGLKVIIGSDPRLSSAMLKSAVASGLQLGGLHCIDVGTVPTPLVPLMVLRLKAAGGVMITASHNPVPDNGIKFFGPDGQKASGRIERAIEETIDRPGQLHSKETRFGSLDTADVSEEYLAHLARALKPGGNGRTCRIVLDCAHGATSELAARAFAAAGLEVSTIHDSFDGSLINVKSGATDLGSLKRVVVSRKADLGLAFDGDGDRVLAVDHEGNPVSGDKILALFVTRIKRYRDQGQLVMTHMTNLGVEQALNERGIVVVRTEVGDIKVLAAMVRHNLQLGGEQSGHIIMSDVLPSGDGIAAGLRLAALVRSSGRTLKELAAEFPEFPQTLTNLKVADKHSWKDNPELKSRLSRIRSSHRGVRFYLRPSGTEDLIRVLTEARDPELCQRSNQAVCEVLLDWDKS
jgi:phosphoglucosamine mutase